MFASLAAAALLTTALSAGPASFEAASATSSCLLTNYVGSTTLGTITKTATVTHATQYGIPANGSVNTSKTALHRLTLTGSFKMSTGVTASTGLIPKIIGKIQGTVGYEVAVQGEKTVETSTSVQVNVKNPYSTKDVAFIAYSGELKLTGTWKISYCKGTGGGTNLGTIAYYSGTYGTWGAHAEGGVGCWSTGGVAIQVKARSLYC
jgi:hypothetical protein